jgi:hypothetical protein
MTERNLDGRLCVKLISGQERLYLFEEIESWRIIRTNCQHVTEGELPLIMQILYKVGYEAIPWNNIESYQVYFNTPKEVEEDGVRQEG